MKDILISGDIFNCDKMQYTVMANCPRTGANYSCTIEEYVEDETK